MGAKDVIDVQVTVGALTSERTKRLVDAGYQHKPHVTHDHVPAGEDANLELSRKLFFIQPKGSPGLICTYGRPGSRTSGILSCSETTWALTHVPSGRSSGSSGSSR
jgi:hypothetical protein